MDLNQLEDMPTLETIFAQRGPLDFVREGNASEEPHAILSEIRAPASPSSSSIHSAQVKRDPEEKSDAYTRTEETNYLEQLIKHAGLTALESGVSIGIDLLDQLKLQLSACQSTGVDAWLSSIKKLKEGAEPTRTVVGVVGNTGAGKSSVINALLDEERLLPTNCLRACTASPTEISYNYSEDPAERYQAEVIFITLAEWLRELEILFHDLLDSNGETLRDSRDPDSEAGIAYAKLKAVYSHKTREMIAKGTPQDFANEPSIQAILGSVKLLSESSPEKLYQKLQVYVDSKEKTPGSNFRKRTGPIEYWPLIKVVRIYTKASALSTGAVVVDLPGVQDSNTARAAVAENYMKLCTGLWIVAPITRAVDDKTAKSLLGDSFKRQLKYDGTYSAVSFICSKTDDISITEAVDSLDLEEEISESWNKAEILQDSKQSSELALAELREQKEACRDKMDDIEAKSDEWDALKTQVEHSKIVYSPLDNPQKRKRRVEPFTSRKHGSIYHSDMDDDDWDAYEDEEDVLSDGNSQLDSTRQPLTKEAIEAALASFKVQQKEIRQERQAIDVQMRAVHKEIQEAESERSKILAEVKARCIRGRNDYSRGAIKQDFASGIKELDQENAAEEDEETFNPEEDLRDYDEVARTLPVFCVSSRAYQKLSGRLQKDDFRSDGFMSPEDTEIPQLQQHTQRLTEAGRKRHCRSFLNELVQLINSMKLWTTNDETQCTLTDGEKRREEMHLRKLLNDLEKGLKASGREAVTMLRRSLDKNIFRVLDSSIPLAVDAATSTAISWGGDKSSGGLAWSTYKAIVRRDGIYGGAKGLRDFNQELFEPISRNLATGWERTFQRRVPAYLDEFGTVTQAKLKEFHEAVQAGVRQRGKNVSGLATLSSQALVHMRTLERLTSALRTTITGLQREVNRKFTPVICTAMKHVYNICAGERGSGSYNRMKAAMRDHVDTARYTMFHEAAQTVKARLEDLCQTITQQMEDEMDRIFDMIFREYMQVVVGTTIDHQDRRFPMELSMRSNVDELLQRSDSLFAPALGELGTEK
ncbi:hypothetical protein F4818DRAFT_437499 [Hypoxylon cercidicola]|nr:hypothetical protein F4818DRAFT_437499 [Hypoxylon cercidicola]